MSEVLNSPAIKAAIKFEQSKNGMRAQLASLFLSTKTWDTMSEAERKVCVHHIVSQSESELELSRRLNEIGCIDCAIRWSEIDLNDETSLEAQALVKALGGLVAKNGSLVMVMTAEDLY